uniref:non-specific serine/threonine protein kinase n=1 Tax=Heterorhabditis bacteriophora TaxID=37862 RepID=A0A1I7WBU2_HETBA
MRNRIARGYYAFPPEEWDHVSQSTKDDIRSLLRTDPSERMTIHHLMQTPLVRGKKMITYELIRFLQFKGMVLEFKYLQVGNVLWYILKLEEVGRALEMMRLGNDPIFVKSPQASCNNLLARRRTAHMSIPRIQC